MTTADGDIHYWKRYQNSSFVSEFVMSSCKMNVKVIWLMAIHVRVQSYKFVVDVYEFNFRNKIVEIFVFAL